VASGLVGGEGFEIPTGVGGRCGLAFVWRSIVSSVGAPYVPWRSCGLILNEGLLKIESVVIKSLKKSSLRPPKL